MTSGLRPGERAADLPDKPDAGLVFIGRIHTPWQLRDDCPRQGRLDGPECRVDVFPPFDQALKGIGAYQSIELLYWLHHSRRDLLQQNPKSGGEIYGTFALRSPVRPNPIGTSLVRLVRVEDGTLIVQGLDCLDGTPLIDIKPDRCAYTPKAPEKAGVVER